MQNKGFIRVVAVLLTLICLFYLSFSVVTAIYNNKAKEYAAGDEAKYKTLYRLYLYGKGVLVVLHVSAMP